MDKVSKIVGLCSRPLQRRYLAATPEERASLEAVVEKESGWIIGKMAGKGYVLEGTVAGIYGIFTRGQARGTIRVLGTSSDSFVPGAPGTIYSAPSDAASTA